MITSFAALLLSSCQTQCDIGLKVLNEVKLQTGYTQNVLKDNVLAQKFVNEVADFVLQDATQTSAIAPTEVLMNFATILFSSNNTEAAIQSIGFDNNDELAMAYKNMQSFLNFNYVSKYEKSFLKTASFYQIVDILYDELVLKDIYEKTDISVIKSNTKDATSDATAWINERTGITITPPQITDPGFYSYNVTNLQDAFSSTDYDKHVDAKITYKQNSVESYEVDGIKHTNYVRYYYDEDRHFQVVQLPIRRTSLIFVVPDENIELSTISFKDIDLSRMEYKSVELTVPFFKVALQEYDIASFMRSKLINVTPFDKIITGAGFLSLSKNVFEFNRYGVSGQSITMSGAPSSAPPIDDFIQLTVDRPFYAISTYNNQALFSLKIVEIK